MIFVFQRMSLYIQNMIFVKPSPFKSHVKLIKTYYKNLKIVI